jgi:hypothetical protein
MKTTPLSKGMLNVLDVMASMTVKRRGKNAGDVKHRTEASSYYYNIVSALHRRGLIDYSDNCIYGTGYGVIKAGLEVLESNKKTSGYGVIKAGLEVLSNNKKA